MPYSPAHPCQACSSHTAIPPGQTDCCDTCASAELAKTPPRLVLLLTGFLRDPFILLLEVRRRRDVTGFFVVELLDRDLHIKSRLLHLMTVELAQLSAEPSQRRALLLKTTLHHAMLGLSDKL